MAESLDRPIGKLFTEVYKDRGAPSSDSPKFRIQLAGIFEEFIPNTGKDAYDLSRYLKTSAGIEVSEIGGYGQSGYRFDKLISQSVIDELLDCITYFTHFIEARYPRALKSWINSVQSAFDKQNLNYEIDEKGGVHHRIDAAYLHSKSLTLACLAGVNFAAAHEEIEKAFYFLTQIPPDNKMAVVNAFLAAENVFKIAIGDNKDLANNTVKSYLTTHVQKYYAGKDAATCQSTGRLVSSFASWADACHPYRHGQHDQNVVAPPDEVAISLVTTGADFIRWLVELSKKPA